MACYTNATFPGLDGDLDTLITKGESIHWIGKGLPEPGMPATDLEGAAILPSFHDTHLHFSAASFFSGVVDVKAARSIASVVAAIRGSVESSTRPVIAFGSSSHAVEEKRAITRRDLDQVPAPVFLTKYDGHAAVLNSAMMKRMPKAVIEHPDFDRESGWAFGTAFYGATATISRSVGPHILASRMAGYANALAKKGIGSLHAVEGMGYPKDLDVDFLRLLSRGFPQDMRVWFQTFDAKKARRRNMDWIGGCFETALDGCFGSKDAALLAPYTDDPENRGVLFHDQATVTKRVVDAHEKGLQISLHAIGDRAVEQALVAFEEARKRCPRKDARHTLIHADLASPSQIERMADLKLGILLQPAFLDWPQEPAHYLETVLGDRLDSLIPLKSYLSAGIPIAAGSDAPCTDPDPISAMRIAVTHPNPAERLRLKEAIDIHTKHAAWLSFDEEKTGAIQKGMRADLAILDSPLTIETLTGPTPPKVNELILKGKPVTEKRFGFAAILRKLIRSI